jgi:hypothetical protein
VIALAFGAVLASVMHDAGSGAQESAIGARATGRPTPSAGSTSGVPVPQGASSSPSTTNSEDAYPASGDADVEDQSSLGCAEDPKSDPKPACHDILPADPPPTDEQLALVGWADDFVITYATYSQSHGAEAAWQKSISPFTGGRKLPVTSVARLDARVRGATAEVTWYHAIEDIPTFVQRNSDGSWEYSYIAL